MFNYYEKCQTRYFSLQGRYVPNYLIMNVIFMSVHITVKKNFYCVAFQWKTVRNKE